MTAKELYDKLNETNKRLEYLENLIGFEVERVEKHSSHKHSESQKRNKGEIDYEQEDEECDYYRVQISGKLTFWLYGKKTIYNICINNCV